MRGASCSRLAPTLDLRLTVRLAPSARSQKKPTPMGANAQALSTILSQASSARCRRTWKTRCADLAAGEPEGFGFTNKNKVRGGARCLESAPPGAEGGAVARGRAAVSK